MMSQALLRASRARAVSLAPAAAVRSPKSTAVTFLTLSVKRQAANDHCVTAGALYLLLSYTYNPPTHSMRLVCTHSMRGAPMRLEPWAVAADYFKLQTTPGVGCRQPGSFATITSPPPGSSVGRAQL